MGSAAFYVQDGVFCNRGFLYGPWLPVYGVGAVLMLLILRRFQKHPVKVFFLAVLLGSFVELLSDGSSPKFSTCVTGIITIIHCSLAVISVFILHWDLALPVCSGSACLHGLHLIYGENASTTTTHFSYAADTGISF